MKTGMRSMKKACVRLAMCGSLFAGLFGGFGSCLSNAAITNYFTAVGNGAIDTAADAVGAVDPAVDAIVVQPAAGFFSDLWVTFVDLWIPTDPTFENLLVQ